MKYVLFVSFSEPAEEILPRLPAELHTNIVQLAPRERVGDYAVAQSSLMGMRGTIAPFAASALLTAFSPQAVMVGAMGLMVAGLVVLDRAVRAATAPPAPPVTMLEVAPA